MQYKIRTEEDRVKRIYKYNLPLLGVSRIFTPPIHSILKVDIQNDIAVFWAIVYSEEEEETYDITGIWTGMKYEEKDGTYIGSLTIDGLVYHYFIREVI